MNRLLQFIEYETIDQQNQPVTTSANENQNITFTANSDQLLSEDKRFYVYVYCDPRVEVNCYYGELDYFFQYEPFYVGKGTGYRDIGHLEEAEKLIGQKLKKCNSIKIAKIHHIWLENKEPIIIKLKIKLTEKESLDLEIFCIQQIGRMITKTGPLSNLTDGGEGMSGHVYSEEYLIELSKRTKKYWDRKDAKVEERRKKHAELTRNNKGMGGAGENNGNYNHRWNEEQRKHMSDLKIGKQLGENNPNYGNGDKIRGDINPSKRPEVRKILSEIFKGSFFVYNKELDIEKRLRKGSDIPIGWVKGTRKSKGKL